MVAHFLSFPEQTSSTKFDAKKVTNIGYIVTWSNGINIFGSQAFTEYTTAIDAAKQHAKYETTDKQIAPLIVTIFDNNNGLKIWKSNDHNALKHYEEYSPEQWRNLQAGHHETYNKPSVYFDIDGTLGKWYPDGRGYAMEEILDPTNHYFRHIEPHPMMIKLAKTLREKGVNVCIISATERETIRDKWEWIGEHCPFIPKENICFAPIGADKSNFVKGNAGYSILIDDYNRNLQEWKGTAFKAINTVNSHQNKYAEIDFVALEKALICQKTPSEQLMRQITKSIHNTTHKICGEIAAIKRERKNNV